MLYIELHEYIYDRTESAGLKIVIHDQHSVPFPEEKGYLVATGHLTNIGLRKVGSTSHYFSER